MPVGMPMMSAVRATVVACQATVAEMLRRAKPMVLRMARSASVATDGAGERECERTDGEDDEEGGEDVGERVDAGEVADLAAGVGAQHDAAELSRQGGGCGCSVRAGPVAHEELDDGRVGEDAAESVDGGGAAASETRGEVAGGGLEDFADDAHGRVAVACGDGHGLADPAAEVMERVASEDDFVRAAGCAPAIKVGDMAPRTAWTPAN